MQQMTLFSEKCEYFIIYQTSKQDAFFFSYPFPIYSFRFPSDYVSLMYTRFSRQNWDGWRKKRRGKKFCGFREDFLVKLFGQTRQAGRGVVSAWVCVQTTSGLFNSFNLVLLWMFQFCYAYCNKCTYKISSFSPSLSSQTNYV